MQLGLGGVPWPPSWPYSAPEPSGIYPPKCAREQIALRGRLPTAGALWPVSLMELGPSPGGFLKPLMLAASALQRPLYIPAPLWGTCCVGSSPKLSFSSVVSRARASGIPGKVRTKDHEGQTWGSPESGFLAVEPRPMAISQDDIGT